MKNMTLRTMLIHCKQCRCNATAGLTRWPHQAAPSGSGGEDSGDQWQWQWPVAPQAPNPIIHLTPMKSQLPSGRARHHCQMIFMHSSAASLSLKVR